MLNMAFKQRLYYRKKREKFTGKELDPETGLYYYGARYLDPKTSRWLSGDPAMGEYFPVAPVNDEAKKRNGNLPGQGGVFNYVNLHAYHYAGNNPVKYVDPDGEKSRDKNTERAINNLSTNKPNDINYSVKMEALRLAGGFRAVSPQEALEIAKDLKEKGAPEMEEWMVSIEVKTLPRIPTGDKNSTTMIRNGMRLLQQNQTGSQSSLENDNEYEIFTVRIYNVQRVNDDGTESPIIRRYIDLNRDGTIDGELLD
jgi:RHS repeat-associated protein